MGVTNISIAIIHFLMQKLLPAVRWVATTPVRRITTMSIIALLLFFAYHYTVKDKQGLTKQSSLAKEKEINFVSKEHSYKSALNQVSGIAKERCMTASKCRMAGLKTGSRKSLASMPSIR